MTRYLAMIAALVLLTLSPASAMSTHASVRQAPTCSSYSGPTFWVCTNLEKAGRKWVPVSGGPVEGFHNCYLLFGEVQSIFDCREGFQVIHFDPNLSPSRAA